MSHRPRDSTREEKLCVTARGISSRYAAYVAYVCIYFICLHLLASFGDRKVGFGLGFMWKGGDLLRRKWLVLHRHVSFGLIWRVSFFTEARRTSVYAFSARAAVQCVTVMMRGEVGSFRPGRAWVVVGVGVWYQFICVILLINKKRIIIITYMYIYVISKKDGDFIDR